MVASLAAWIVGWLRGQRTVRDEHGRLKPVPAVLARFAALIAIALLIALVDQWRS